MCGAGGLLRGRRALVASRALATTSPRPARRLQAGNFTSAFVLAPVTGGGMYIKAEALRFGPGETPFNTAADPSGAALEFAKSYYTTYAAGKAG